MDIVSVIVFVIVAVLVWWLLTTYILPRLHEPFRTIVIVLCVLVAILWLLSLIGIGPGVNFR